MVVYCFSFRGHPPGINEFTSLLCSHSRRIRRRLLYMALRRLLQVALLRTTGGQGVQVAFLRSSDTPGGQLALLRRPCGNVGKVVLCPGRKVGKVGNMGARFHTLGSKVSGDEFHVLDLNFIL